MFHKSYMNKFNGESCFQNTNMIHLCLSQLSKMLSSVFILLSMFIVISKWIHESLHALLSSNLDMLHWFWVHVIWVPKLKISVCMCGRKIWVLCKLWWMVATVQKFHYEALKTLKMLWFSVLRQWIIGGLSIWTLPGGS